MYKLSIFLLFFFFSVWVMLGALSEYYEVRILYMVVLTAINFGVIIFVSKSHDSNFMYNFYESTKHKRIILDKKENEVQKQIKELKKLEMLLLQKEMEIKTIQKNVREEVLKTIEQYKEKSRVI